MIWLGAGFLGLYALWVFYLAIMNLKRADDAAPLTGSLRVFAMLVLAPGYLLDFLANVTVFPLVLLDFPRGWLVTGTLTWHVKNSSGYRHKVAVWFCSTLLDRFDPSGCHCK